ncbi:unnamed protein product [Closterium sp. NIES-54]
MAAVTGWGNLSNMPTTDGTWGADEPDETTWGETPAARNARLLAEAKQRVAEMDVLDSGRLVGVEPIPAASDQESGELVLAPGEYVDVEVRVPPPNLTRYVAPVFDHIRSDGHQLLLSFFANAEYYLRAQGHKATGETWHKRLGHPSQSTLNNTIKAAVLDKNSLLLPSGLELKPMNRPAPCIICPAANLPHEPFPTHFPGADDYQLMDKVYSDILNLPEDGFNGERYVITFTDASTRYVWTGNMTNRFLAFTAFRTWLPLAERESDTKLKAFQCDGAGEYRSTEFTTYLQERGIRRLFSLPHAHQQSGVAERLNRTLQEKMRALLAQAQLGPLYWPFTMDHATLLHNLLSSSSLPNNASPHLLWTGKLGTTKLLRVFGCIVQYRPPTAPLGKFDQRAKWGLHLGIEKQYSAWRIMDYRSRLLVPARDCIFYENLTLPVFEQHLASQQNPATLFHGVRSFANADVELAASEEPDSDGAREAAPDPPVPVTSSGIPEFIPLADAAPEDVRELEPGAQPTVWTQWRLTQPELEELLSQIDALLKKGFIRASTSPFAAPILFTPKKDGGLRMCIDYRALNRVTIKSRYPIPRTDDLLDQLRGARYFSKIDLRGGYHQIRVFADDCHKTAFRTRYISYEFTVMPFGLTNAPSTLQLSMNRIFRDLLDRCVIVYLDDILFFSKTQEHHLRDLDSVFKENRLITKGSKCKICKQELEFLGHVVSRDGIKVDPAKIKTIQEWKSPTNITELKSFLGFVNYVRRFIPNMAGITGPLTDMLHKDMNFVWGEEAEAAFQMLKKILVSPPVLRIDDPSKPFEVVTNASDFAIGAVLL